KMRPGHTVGWYAVAPVLPPPSGYTHMFAQASTAQQLLLTGDDQSKSLKSTPVRSHKHRANSSAPRIFQKDNVLMYRWGTWHNRRLRIAGTSLSAGFSNTSRLN